MAKYKKKLDDDIRCPLEYGLAIFGGKWKSSIICVLAANERLRYSQIRKEMYNITDAVLSATLRDLIEDGIIDRKRSLAAGLIIQKILNENGLSEDSLKYSEDGKPLADNLFFNISHAGDYVVGVSSDREVGCDIEKIVDAPLGVSDRFFI